MKSLKGSKTEQNLIRLFALESQDRNRFSYFSSQAKKDGFVLVAAILEETAIMYGLWRGSPRYPRKIRSG